MALRTRLQSLEVSGFLCHTKTAFDLRRGRIVVLNGRVGDGKTAIKQALQFLLSGNPGLDRGGSDREAADLQNDAPDAPRLRVTGTLRIGDGTEEVECWRSSANGSHTRKDMGALLQFPADQTFASPLGVVQAVDVVLSPGRFLDLKTEGRRQFADRACGAPLTPEMLAKMGIEDPDVAITASKSIKNGLARASKERLRWEAEARGLSYSMPEDAERDVYGKKVRLSAISPATYSEAIQRVKAQRDAKVREAAGVRATATLSRDAAEKAVRDAEAAAGLRRQEADAARRALATHAAGASAVEACRAGLPGLRDRIAALGASQAASAASRKTAEAELAALGKPAGGHARCPTCLRPSDPAEEGRIRAALAEEVRKRIEADTAAEAKAGKALAEARGLLEADGRTVGGYDEQARSLKVALEHAETMLRHAEEGVRVHREALAGVKDPAEVEARAKAVDAEVAKMDGALAYALETLALAGAYHKATREMAAVKRQRDEALQHAASYERMEKILAEDGPVAARFRESGGRLASTVAEVSRLVGIPVELTDDMEVLMDGKRAGLRSEGQRYLAGVVVGAALSILSGLRLLWVDSVGTLDSESKNAVMKAVLALTAGDRPPLEQVFLCALRGNEGWCDGCRMMMVGPKCPKCHGAVGLVRPRHALIRLFEFTGRGQVREVMPETVGAGA